MCVFIFTAILSNSARGFHEDEDASAFGPQDLPGNFTETGKKEYVAPDHGASQRPGSSHDHAGQHRLEDGDPELFVSESLLNKKYTCPTEQEPEHHDDRRCQPQRDGIRREQQPIEYQNPQT